MYHRSSLASVHPLLRVSPHCPWTRTSGARGGSSLVPPRMIILTYRDLESIVLSSLSILLIYLYLLESINI